MAIQVTGEAILPAGHAGENVTTLLSEQYTDRTGLRRAQFRSYEADSDFWEGSAVRYSGDNGRTWGPWEDFHSKVYSEAADGSWEMHDVNFRANQWNPVHKHYIGFGLQLIWKGGHKASYDSYFSKGEAMTWYHTYMLVRREGSQELDSRLVRFEPGPDFDPENPADEAYGLTNHAYFYMTPVITESGDVLIGLSPLVSACLQILGRDPEALSGARGNCGLILARGVWNGEHYDFTFSRPVVISDLLSSRGIDEPTTALLKSGRIVVVFRGSNWRAKWTRVEPGTPGFKWYCYSDDGGKTFTDPMPWHFGSGEVIYSSATISHFVRSEKNGRLYWIGNITGSQVDGNYPRWPLQIVEVDETCGFAKKETLTVVDTRRDGESEAVQLSNFNILQDRETGHIELLLSKFGQLGDNEPETYHSETWKYIIDV